LQNIVVDAGPLIAMFARSDRHHKSAMAFLDRSESATLVTNLGSSTFRVGAFTVAERSECGLILMAER
jgi:hypothetical protein